MASASPTAAQHHYHEAERVLATIGGLGVVEEEAQREALTALCHAVLALTAAVLGRDS